MFERKSSHYNHHNFCHDRDNQASDTSRKQNSSSNSMASSGSRVAGKLGQPILTTTTTINKSKNNKQALRTTVLWAIFLYGLLQFAANLPSGNNSSHLLKLQREAPTISKTVIESSLNEDRESPKDGCNRSSKQQLCSSKAAEAHISQEASLIKSTQRPLFSSTSSSSSLPSVIHSSLLKIFDKFSDYIINASRGGRSLFGSAGPRIWMAEAASTLQPEQQQEAEKGIVVLNSTNFNRELLQNRHSFPHIKLIEFYVAYCGFCSKFKPTYNNLAKEIYSWRNVIRPSMIDVSTNLPIARSWRVDTVPTLRVCPPPTAQLASKIDKQLFKMMKDNDESSEDRTHDYLYTEYTAAKPMVQSLEPATYLNDIHKFKTVLLEYINSYVRSSTLSDGRNINHIPETWPNLRPVGEESLSKLLANHPRQELFLMIQGPADQSQPDQANMAFQVMLELSSTASWKAVRYVKASENKALVEDVISQLKKLSRQPANQINEQVKILENFLTDKPSSEKGNIVLVHTDDSHSLVKMEGSSFAFISAMTGQDLLNAEQHSSSSSESGGSRRAKRDISERDRERRSAATLETLPSDVQAELIARHISHTYTETKEDRKFTRALNQIYRDISMEPDPEPTPQPEDSTTIKSTESHPTTNLTGTSPQQQLSSSPNPTYTESSPRANYVDDEDSGDEKNSNESVLTKLNKLLFNGVRSASIDPDSSNSASSGDYFDKIKAIRYIFFNEIPRTSFADKSLAEQQEKLNILLNLVSVIKSYFPMADSSSIQFMDGVHTYLLKQQSKLLSVNNQQSDGLVVLDTRAFKQELKRLEGQDKRLPEVKEFRHCVKGGYPCALWRLFHTLTAFEYKKLNQIRLIPSQQISTGLQLQQSQQPAELISSLSHVEPAPEPMSRSGSSNNNSNGALSTINSNSDVPSPGERLVSPPSTTTSLSLTIVGPSTSSSANGNNNNNQKRITEADLPTPVLLVMRDYVTNFFGCTECSKNFQQESADLSLERIRHQEPAEFSILWLWETHNRVNKRLSVDPATNPPDNPKMWFPSYSQCSKCYMKPPSFLKDESIAKDGPAAIFYESIEWDRQEILNFLASEYTKQPLEPCNLFGHHLPYDFGYILAGCLCLLILTLLARCFTRYVERQRRHKATLLNGNGAHYTLELQ